MYIHYSAGGYATILGFVKIFDTFFQPMFFDSLDPIDKTGVGSIFSYEFYGSHLEFQNGRQLKF